MGLLVRALAVALAASLVSPRRAILAGLGVGVVERVIFFNWPGVNGLVELCLFVLVLFLVLFVGAVPGSRGDGGWSFTSRVRPLPARLRVNPCVQGLTWGAGVVGLAVALVVPLVLDTSAHYFTFTRIALISVVVLSVTILVGWGGQLSLAQFAFAGLGAMCMAGADLHLRLQFAPALLLSVIVCTAAAAALGFPSFRLRGMQLAIVTMVFAVAAYTWWFRQEIFNGGGVSARYEPSSLDLGWVDLGDRRTYYLLCLTVLVVAMAMAYRIRRSGFGRALIAVRQDEAVVSAYAVRPRRVKLTAFALSGGMAGLAGALLMPVLVNARPESFDAGLSLSVVAMAVIGGLASVAGAVIGAAWVVGLPMLFDDSELVALGASGLGMLVLIMYFPGGLSRIGVAARDLVARWADERSGAHVPSTPPTERPRPVVAASPGAEPRAPSTGPLLQVADLSVSFGGREVVHGVSLEVGRQETVGLIGANGAGKSTIMNALGGFVPSTGTVHLDGVDVSGWSPARRAAAGLGRSFQNAALFGDLTVLETVSLAHERGMPTSTVAVLTGLPAWRRRNRDQLSRATALIDYLGLGRYCDHLVSSLSTGTRRICELACMLALEPRMICLDEPTAGVAQRETEAFAPLIGEIRRDLGASLLVVEHDMPFVMAVSDRVYCLDNGRMLAEGSPVEVRNDPLVVASYLGTNEQVIQRSDAWPATVDAS